MTLAGDLLRARAGALSRAVVPSLETLFTHPAAFGLTTASPLQRAVCRVIDGRPLGKLAEREEVRAAFGDVEALPTVRPAEVLLLSGIRTAKSLIAAATAVRASQTCDLSRLGPGETPRVSVVSLTVDLSRVVYQHIVGNVTAQPALRSLLVGEPTADTIVLRHPSGRPVEIRVVAGARAGASLVARWSAGCIFDEAPRMVGAEEHVVNYDDCRAAVIGRLLPGAQVISIGSPWAPFGPIYQRVTERFGKPGRDLVVIRASAPAMNPVTWTPEKVEELRRTDPTVYRTDVLGEFVDPESSLIPLSDIEKATRSGPRELPPLAHHEYFATIDPATRGNAWTLNVATLDPKGKLVVALARQWVGTQEKPLSPRSTLLEVREACAPYRVDVVRTDQFSSDALKDIGRAVGLHLVEVVVTGPLKVELFGRFATRLAQGEVELPPDPAVRTDLLNVRRRVTQAGVAIDLPKTSDGRHCDYAASLALLCSIPAVAAVIPEPVPDPGTVERLLWDAAKEKERAIDEARRRAARDWRANVRRR